MSTLTYHDHLRGCLLGGALDGAPKRVSGAERIPNQLI